MRVYADSSALLKRAVDEPERPALLAELNRLATGGAMVISSTISFVEVSRVVRLRLDSDAPERVVDLIESALSGVIECPMTEQVTSIARRLGPASLRSLDAIHLASASLFDVDLVLAYDRRMLTAASELGFRTMSPA
ncbi:MAG: hypothetical protein JWP85_1379 [Rhodoglobus sp.]|nr:hypothetical protein [Rhodoglobus sp.]